MGLLDVVACNFQTKETFGACLDRRAEEKAAKTGQDAKGTETSLGTRLAVDANNNIEAHNTSLEKSLNIY